MPDDTPTEAVLSMRQQGLSNNQIVTALQREGYTSPQILDAMNQADMRQQTIRPFDTEGDRMAYPTGQMQSGGLPPPGAGPAFMGAGDELPAMDGSTERLEELAEAIIDEKWNDLMENINRIVAWKEKTEERLIQMETMMKSIKDEFDKIHTSVLERVGDYDKHISEVGTEVKALEKVFQKVLPGFIENVAELSKITASMKQHAQK